MHRITGRSPARARRGFTLIEIILVVMIIMTLAAVVGTRLVGKAKKAKMDATRIQISSLKTTLGEFEVRIGRFPTTSEGLDALVHKPSTLSDKEWTEKFVDDMPKDSWGQPFDYKCPSEHGKDYDIISAGPDKKFGSDDDISNFEADKTAGATESK